MACQRVALRVSGSGAHTHQRPSVAPELLPIGWARRGRRARAWLAALSCEHRLERVLLAGADGLLARWRLRWRRCARRARHLARRRRAPSWRWGRNCLKINIISKSGYLVCWGVLCTSRNTSETRAPVSRTHNTRTRGPRERRATARWCAGRSCVPGPCACVEQGWVGDAPAGAPARGSLRLDPHLPHGLEHVPMAGPALGEHDRVAADAAARGAVGVGEEEDALDDEEGLGGPPRRHLERAGRAHDEADACRADLRSR